MAIYHFSAKVISRAVGSSAVAVAAYRSADRLHDERLGRSHDFSNKAGVAHSEVMLPEGADEQWRDRERLWNDVEAAELRKDAQLAREIEFKQGHLRLAREIAGRHHVGYDRGFLSWMEYVKPQIEAERVGTDLAQLERQLEAAQERRVQLHAERRTEEIEWTLAVQEIEREGTDARGALARLRHESAARQASFRELDRHLRRMRARYRAKRDALVEALTDALPEARVHGIRAGLHIAVQLREGDQARTIREEALRRGVALTPMSDYYLDRTGDSSMLLLGYGRISEAGIRAGVRELAAAIQSIRRADGM